jgi:hypothetical protein
VVLVISAAAMVGQEPCQSLWRSVPYEANC